MSEEKKGFTVKDRRLFTPDGRLREPEPEPAPPPPTGAQAAEHPPAAKPGERDAPVEFAGFLLSLGAQAVHLLEAGDLRGARSLIAILEMLKDKSEGRRTAEESSVLEGVLYELRMGYVSRTSTGGA
jgi:hypothetical protein